MWVVVGKWLFHILLARQLFLTLQTVNCMYFIFWFFGKIPHRSIKTQIYQSCYLAGAGAGLMFRLHPKSPAPTSSTTLSQIPYISKWPNMNIFTFFLAYWEVGYSETWPSACTRAGNAPHPEKASGSDPSEASQNQDRLLLQQGPPRWGRGWQCWRSRGWSGTGWWRRPAPGKRLTTPSVPDPYAVGWVKFLEWAPSGKSSLGYVRVGHAFFSLEHTFFCILFKRTGVLLHSW